jgi:hypothetical protein
VIWASLNCCPRITHAFPDPETGRPADPGQEVDQGAAIGPKERQTAALMAPLYSEAASDQAQKTVTDSARHEFVVCPLMCQIRAFRYFWPNY